MQRLSLIILSIFSLQQLQAQDHADQIVVDMLDMVESYNPYKVDIEVMYENTSISGYYEVDDMNYYIAIDQQELYGNQSVKYEVFNGRKEVIIDSVSVGYDGNILNNPATAFASIRDYYSSSIISENDKTFLVSLSPRDNVDNPSDTIELIIEKSTMLPSKIIYKFGGTEVSIKIVNIENIPSSITLYNSDKYVDYEIIDFR
ncbi:MAG: hypothetical protein SNH73_01585 [Rikenellaceae bacterium]